MKDSNVLIRTLIVVGAFVVILSIIALSIVSYVHAKRVHVTWPF